MELRYGGAYIPPAKLRALQAKIVDKSSEDYQRISWESLKKSINGHINKANVSNIKDIIPQIISENLIRGRGLFCRSIVKSQIAATPFTPVYAAIVAVINTKFPQIGEMLCSRLILLFRRALRRDDKPTCIASSRFIAQLVNHRVMHEIVALEISFKLIDQPSDDSIEIAVGFLKECGAYMVEAQPKALGLVFDQLRSILHEKKDLALRTQYMIEVLFHVRMTKFADNPAIPEGLDLVEVDDQVTHKLSLDDQELNCGDKANLFQFDADFLKNESRYNQIRQ